jgi:hypothetical protein
MLTIRKEQEDVFCEAASQRFIERASEHLKKSFGPQCEALGGVKLREFIRSGVQRADRWDVTTSRNVCIYLDVMMTLGVDFDRDPRLPWIRRILGSQSATETVRIDRLYEAVMRMLDQISSSGAKPDGRRTDGD